MGSDEHRPKMKIKEAISDENRGKRNLEYQISHNYPIGANYRLERRISSNSNYQLPSRYPQFFPGPRPHHQRGRPHSIPAPSYAVQMEPLVQYSQRDPLYDSSKIPLTAGGHNELSKPDDLLTDHNHLSEHVYSHQSGGPYRGHNHGHGGHGPVYYQKEPEPIIEIIIKESNVTLPPIPVPAALPKQKEPVQVFYVKYKKNPNGYGKDSVIYDKPVPALTPHVQEDHEEQPQLDQPHQEYVTASPPASTTLRTIIRPESETYMGTSGIHVTFGSDHKKSRASPEGHEESAPQPAVIFPQASQNQPFHQPQQIHHFNHHQPQFSPQAVPEKRPAAPHFNPPVNFNQQSFGPPRPGGPPGPPQFNHQQYRAVHQQPARPFPVLNPSHQHQPRHPGGLGPQRPFQQPPFAAPQQQRPPGPPGPVGPPQPLHPPHRPQFSPNKEFERPPQFPPQFPPPNQQFGGQNHAFNQQNQFGGNSQFPPNQFNNFQPQHFPPKQQFAQLLSNHRPQTHFPVVQNNNNQFNQQAGVHQPHNPPQQQRHIQPQVRPHPQNQQFPQPEQQHFQAPHVIPPGGELVKSVPRYEQHISVPADQPAASIQNAHDTRPPQALPQTQRQPQPSSSAPLNGPFNNNPHVNQQQSYQQLQSQLQQQINLQVQQQIQQQPKILSTPDFQQQISQQFQFPLQNFAQLTTLQNKQSQDQILTSPGTQQQQSLPPDYYLNSNTQFPNIYHRPQSPTTSLPTSTPKLVYASPTTPSSTTTTTTNRPAHTEDKKILKIPSNIILPDEVPDDLREQLLSSGILNNADISVLDYDKVGDIPIDALPPDQLANFYGAGGAQQISASERKSVVVRPDGEAILPKDRKVDMDQELSAEESEMDETVVSTPNQVRMKVVHYDSTLDDGRSIPESYVQQDSTQVDPVVLNDNKYNRYLPLKVSGAQFPIPDVPELKGKNITSVVVLAPVDYEFHQHHGERNARDIEGDIKDVQFRAGEDLKILLMNPSKENYKRWLDSEKQTTTDKQSVVLLVTG